MSTSTTGKAKSPENIELVVKTSKEFTTTTPISTSTTGEAKSPEHAKTIEESPSCVQCCLNCCTSCCLSCLTCLLVTTCQKPVDTITITRDPSQTIPTTNLTNGHTIDPQWASTNNLTTLELYFASLTHKKSKQDWLKQVFLTIAKSRGYVGPSSQFAVGVLLGLTPTSYYSTSPDVPLDVNVALSQQSVSAATALMGMPMNQNIRPWAALQHGESDSSPQNQFSNILWPLPKSTPPVSITLPEDLLQAEKTYLAAAAAAAAEAAPPPPSPQQTFQPDTPIIHHDSTELHPELLPGLCIGKAGLESNFTPREHFRNRYLSAVLNRLISNMNHRHPPSDLSNAALHSSCFVVHVHNKPCRTVIEFFQALGDKSVFGHVQSGITVFGMHLHVKDAHTKSKVIPIARCVGTKTGIIDEESGKEITFPVAHSGMSVLLKLEHDGVGKDIEGHVQYFTGTEGFTGYHPDGEDTTINVAGKVLLKRTSHSNGFLPHSKFLEFAKNGTALAIVAATCAEEHNMPCGGYAQWGVCQDSANILQQASGMQCTTAPGSGNGVARQKLGRCARRLAQEVKEVKQELERDLRVSEDTYCQVAQAIVTIPCDATPSPSDVVDLASRLLTSVPGESAVECFGEGGVAAQESLRKVCLGIDSASSKR